MTSLAVCPAEHEGTGPNQYLAKYEYLTIDFVLSMSSADFDMAKFLAVKKIRQNQNECIPY